jgi:biopolymer transport protein ExbD
MKQREKRKLRWRNRIKASTSVNLISMMDILTVLLLFLLKSYVAEGEVMVPAPGVRLPSSTAQQGPRASLIVAIEGDAIRIGNERVASVAEVVASDLPEIEPLAARLQALRATAGDSSRSRAIATSNTACSAR